MSCIALDKFESVAPMIGDTGVCPDTESGKVEIIKALNEAIEAMMKRLDSKGTLWEWCLPVSGGCFGLPEDVLEARQAWLNGQSLQIRDEWWQGALSVGLKESWYSSCSLRCGAGDFIDIGDGFPSPNPWPQHQNTKLALVAENEGDAGVKVQVRVLDEYGNEQEEFVTLQNNLLPSITESHVTSLTFLHKPVTKGAVKAYVYYDHNGLRTGFAYYRPRTTNPSYRRKKLPGGASCGTLLIKGKRRFQPIVSETDPLQICDTQALKWGVQAIAASHRRNGGEYNAFLGLAINELEKELQDGQSAAAVSQAQFKSPFGRALAVRAWH